MRSDLRELALAAGDMRAVRDKLKHMGYHASLVLMGPHDRIKFKCDEGGRGVMCSHSWYATPMEVLEDGCPHCKLNHEVENAPIKEVPESVLLKAIKAQHKSMSAALKRAKKRSFRHGNNYGVTRYTL